MSEDTTTDLPILRDGTASHKQEPVRLSMDASRYLEETDGFELAEAQKVELLQTLWSIMHSMVELGFSHHLCEQVLESFNDCAESPEAAVELPLPTKKKQRTPREERNGDR